MHLQNFLGKFGDLGVRKDLFLYREGRLLIHFMPALLGRNSLEIIRHSFEQSPMKTGLMFEKERGESLQVLQNAFNKGCITLPYSCLFHYSVLMPHKEENWKEENSTHFQGFNAKCICCRFPVWTQTSYIRKAV